MNYGHLLLILLIAMTSCYQTLAAPCVLNKSERYLLHEVKQELIKIETGSLIGWGGKSISSVCWKAGAATEKVRDAYEKIQRVDEVLRLRDRTGMEALTDDFLDAASVVVVNGRIIRSYCEGGLDDKGIYTAYTQMVSGIHRLRDVLDRDCPVRGRY